VIIYEPIPESHDVLNKDIAFAIIKLLEGVTEGGSGNRLRTEGGGYGYNRMTGYPYKFTNPIAGKTGTTQNQSDGWFMEGSKSCDGVCGLVKTVQQGSKALLTVKGLLPHCRYGLTS
jgi:cell division protein FtsI/penicillin-binding protein 2